jgi:colicin import membrane protein
VRGGLFFSVVLHAAILGWALFTIQMQPELRAPEPEPLAVELVTPGDVTKLKQGSRTAKQLEAQAKETPKPDIAKKEADKPKPVAAAPPPPPPPPEPPAPKEPEKKADPIAEKLAAVPPPPPAAPEPPPAPAPSFEEQKKLEELMREQERQAEEQRKAEEQKKLEEQKRLEEEARKQAELKKKQEEAKKKKEAELKKKREEEKKRKEAEAKKFDAEKMAALLNKIPDKGAPPPSSEPTEPTKNRGPALGAPEGRDKQLAASEVALLKATISRQLSPNWRLVAAGGGSDIPMVTLKWRLKPDGSLDGDPQIVQPRGDPMFRLAAEAAIRAVQQSSPFPLPTDKYAYWKVITWEFDPSQIRGQ